MPSEGRRGISRITANYGRLMCTFAMGLVLVPLQLAWLGNDGFAVLALLGASVGITATLQEVMRQSLVRELGAAWHDRDQEQFTRFYASAIIICAIVAAITAVLFGLLLLILPLMRVPDSLLAPARWIVAAEGLWTCLLILLAPAFNMYVVRERFQEYNFWLTANRASYLAAALVLFLVMGVREVAPALILFGITAASLNIVQLLVAVAILIRGDTRFIPRLSLADRASVREVAGTFGWYTAVVVALNLHERVGAIIMNLVFGLWGNTIFGLALRLVSYVRMATLGMTFGLDAVSARLSTANDHQTLRSVVRHSTRLHGYIALPSGLAVFLLAEPLLRLWVGRYVEDPDPQTGLPVLASAVVLVRVLVIGLICRAIADGWIKLLYGAGHVRRYAPLVLAGGLANPVLALLLFWILPEPTRYTGAAWGFTAVFLVVHLGLLPAVGAVALGIPWRAMMAPLVRPLVLTAIPAPALIAPLVVGDAEPIGWMGLLLSCATYSLLYGGLGILFGLSPQERRRAVALLRPGD
jgi:O-antigen/teichoic acid export membrane protein